MNPSITNLIITQRSTSAIRHQTVSVMKNTMTTTPHSDPNAPCRHTISLQDFTHIAVGPALFLILVLSLLEKRRNPRRCRCCGDRPGLLVPVNLLDGDEDRLAYAAAFGSTATNCLNLFGGGYISQTSPMWTQVLLAMMAVTEMGIDYYPFFACLGKKHSIMWSFTGLAYAIIWFLVNLGHVFECADAHEWVFKGQPIVLQLPVLACLLYLVITFFLRFISALLRAARSLTLSHTQHLDEMRLLKETKLKYELVKSHQVNHVKELLKGKRSNLPYLDSSSTDLGTFFNYRRDPTFRYSPRITATFTVAFLCLYEFGLFFFLAIEKAIGSAKDSLLNTNTSDSIVQVFGMGFYNHLTLLLLVVQMSWYVAFGVSSVVMVNYIVRIFLSYKVQIKRLMRGDHSLVPQHCKVLSRSKIVAHSLMYSGSQIAYILWGYYVMITALFFCGLLLSYLFVLPLLGLVSNLFLEPLWTILPTIIMSYAVYYLQIFISKKILLQNEHYCSNDSLKVRRVLALDNRRVYHNVSYFLFFYHILLGLYTCLVRVGKGIFLGVVFLGRIDRSGLVKGFEHWDTGYLSFVSFLQVEVAHTHPVMLVFCQLLLNANREKKLVRRADSKYGSSMELSSWDRTPRSTSRWWKAYTLIRNPTLQRISSGEHWAEKHLHIQ